ncbi:OmpA family protein [Enhygromyxa salina]|uniref:Outer membrane porin F n=1 Tax=Enhygromyxa salina TaxID=215803 RepID=A0A2S9YV28_9BACT|nr:OmpA family protein [Enhygromyxa salina]PRQ08943.1 Outer membrane porin F precursor [Enhygromyxa salina]
MNTPSPFTHLTLLSGSVVLLLACAHTPPSELVDARDVYDRAAEGPSKKYTPAELHVAQVAMELAERSFKDREDPMLVRDQAYIAMRKAERAESGARTIMYDQSIETSQWREEELEDADAVKTKSELTDANSALDAANHALDDEKTAGVAKNKALAAEKQLRLEAEARAAKARDDLARVASVKQDARGTVITLSGSVLFSSNRYELLPGAQAKLSQVANALLAGDPAATFVVEGHTDSQGKPATNQTLSVNRANAVRDYLVQHDIAADRITAQGYGETRTVSDNGSAEGRANNRRVEIVVSSPANG